MDINNYYSRPNYQPSATVPAPGGMTGLRMSRARADAIGGAPAAPAPTYSGEMPGGFDENTWREFMQSRPDQDQIAPAMQREANARAYASGPPPAVGEIDPTTNQELSRIYYRHYLNGTYGTPEMMAEVRATVEAYRRREEERKRLMAGYRTLPGQETTAGTFVRPGDFIPLGDTRRPPNMRPVGAVPGQKPTPPRPTPILGGGLLPRV